MKLEYLSEDELKLTGLGYESEVYLMGYGEAEVKTDLKKADSITTKKAAAKIGRISKKIAKKLLKLGYDDVHFLAEKGTPSENAYGDSKVCHQDFSEYMMKWQMSEKYVFGSEAEIVLMGVEADDTDMEQKDAVIVNSAEAGVFTAKVMPYRDGVYVFEVEVNESMRRRGKGYKYMHSLMNAFKDTPIYLQVGSKNAAACGLYRKLGFEVVQELCYYIV